MKTVLKVILVTLLASTAFGFGICGAFGGLAGLTADHRDILSAASVIGLGAVGVGVAVVCVFAIRAIVRRR